MTSPAQWARDVENLPPPLIAECFRNAMALAFAEGAQAQYESTLIGGRPLTNPYASAPQIVPVEGGCMECGWMGTKPLSGMCPVCGNVLVDPAYIAKAQEVGA